MHDMPATQIWNAAAVRQGRYQIPLEEKVGVALG